MRILNAPEWFLLAYIGLFLPWAAVRSRRRLAPLESLDPDVRAAADAAMPSTARLLGGTLVTLAALGLFCRLLAPSWNYELFGGRAIDGRALTWGGAALAIQLALMALSRALRSPEERRRLLVRKLIPRNGAEWALMLAVIAAAAFAEEAAYRGLGMLFLGILTGSAWVNALILSVAFAIAHAVQGRQSVLFVFAMALVMHALVALTGTLVIAMVVHALYDLLAVAFTVQVLNREAAAARGTTAA